MEISGKRIPWSLLTILGAYFFRQNSFVCMRATMEIVFGCCQVTKLLRNF
jgi:hypothetical protein